ncbi:histidine phosphatase family protein [Acuticoccus sp.]|uniref:histidine phosphatase family protein n=1 Tax=Acuticoccus sp. TaxID=1904378 RepID=UPI003B52EE7C
MLPDGVRLFHIRHGETDWNAEARLQGQLDIPINARGRGQAIANGERLAARLWDEGMPPEALAYVSSPLGRSRETMALVRAVLGLDGCAATDDRLKEVAFGAWSGHTYAELSAAGERKRVAERKRDKWSFRPPGGETYADLADRIGAWLETVEGDTLAVSHGGVHRVLYGHLCGTPWHEVPGLPAPQDRVFVFADGAVEDF